MLKGGTGLLVLPADIYDTVESDPAIKSITPICVGIAAKESSSIQDDGGTKTFFNRLTDLTIIGVKLQKFGALELREFEGRWLKIPEVQVVGLEQVRARWSV